jgi:hypothetical protein
MEYEGFRDGKSEKIADLHFLGLFIPKKHVLSEKKIRLSRAVAVVIQNLCFAYSLDHDS